MIDNEKLEEQKIMSNPETDTETESVSKGGLSEEGADQAELKPRETKIQSEDRISQIEEIKVKLDDLYDLFVNKLSEDAHKNELFDKMYEELQGYKKNQQQKILESVFKNIIFEIDQNQKLIDYYSEKENEDIDPQKIFDLLKTIPASLENILFSYGVVPMKEDEVFSPEKHKVIEAITTKDKEMDKKIAKTVKRGYECDGKIIREAIVKVYVYKENKGEE